MTVIAAQFCGDCILMATDSKETRSENGVDVLTTIIPKLNILKDKPIAWGFGGAVDVGEDFDRWLMSYVWDKNATWESFKQDALVELSTLNGSKREMMCKAGKEPTLNDVSDVLITGYIGGNPEILEITADGEHYFHKDRQFAVIGSGKTHAQIARRVLQAFYSNCLKQPMPNELFWFIISVSMQLVPDCGLPLQRINVSVNGVKVL